MPPLLALRQGLAADVFFTEYSPAKFQIDRSMFLLDGLLPLRSMPYSKTSTICPTQVNARFAIAERAFVVREIDILKGPRINLGLEITCFSTG
jgi:hypothetical protein